MALGFPFELSCVFHEQSVSILLVLLSRWHFLSRKKAYKAIVRGPPYSSIYAFRVLVIDSYLLGLLAKIKCSICSNQLNRWFGDPCDLLHG